MRIAFVHSFYTSRNPSGENECVLGYAAALRAAGHDVLLLARHTDREERLTAYAARAGLRVATGFGPDPTARLTAFAPDVVHVHNLFPNIGTRWLSRWGTPLVATVQNFRPLCANAYLLRNGSVCTACPDGDRFAGLRYACYRDSRVATLPLALRNARGAGHDPVLARADQVVVVSERARSVYARYGVPDSRLRVVPNFVTPSRTTAAPRPQRERWLGVGRLSPEKGFGELLELWPGTLRLDIVGEGPERGTLEGRFGSPSIRFLGSLPRDVLRQRLGGYTGLVFPSRWYEGSPLVVAEALEAGLPIVALQGNTAADTVLAHAVGEVYDDRDSLTAALDRVANAGDALRRAARRCFDEVFTQVAWTRSMEACYTQVRGARAGQSRTTPVPS